MAVESAAKAFSGEAPQREHQFPAVEMQNLAIGTELMEGTETGTGNNHLQ